MNVRKIVAAVLIPIGSLAFVAGASAPSAKANPPPPNQPCYPCPTAPPCQYYYCGGPGDVLCLLGNTTNGTACADSSRCVQHGECESGYCSPGGSGTQYGTCASNDSGEWQCLCEGTLGGGEASNKCYYQYNSSSGQMVDPGGYCTLTEH